MSSVDSNSYSEGGKRNYILRVSLQKAIFFFFFFFVVENVKIRPPLLYRSVRASVRESHSFKYSSFVMNALGSPPVMADEVI